MTPLVSVVVPCFNYARYLDACLKSLSAQTLTKWECIIVDDGSTDDSPSVCDRLVRADPRVRYLRQANRGLSAARNTGICSARGDFIQLLDADDVLERRKLEVQVGFLAEHADTAIVAGEAAFFDSDSPARVRSWRRSGAMGSSREVNAQGSSAVAAFLPANAFVVHAALVRRKIFDTVGMFDESLRANEDWEFWLRCALKGQRFAFVSKGEDRALVREHSGNMSSSRELMLRTAVEVLSRVQNALQPPLDEQNAAGLARFKAKLALELIRQHKTKEGQALLRDSFASGGASGAVLLEIMLLVPGVRNAANFLRRISARARE